MASAVRMGPRPVRSQSPLIPSAAQNAERNSALGDCPCMYRRHVSALVSVSSASARYVRSPAATSKRSCNGLCDTGTS